MRRFDSVDVLGVVVVAYAWFVLLTVTTGDYRSRVIHCGDNPSYAGESAMLRGAQPSDAGKVQHFLGYSMLVAPVASIAGGRDFAALPIVSAICSVVAVALVATLWGPLVAALFATVNFDWLERSLLGGADPVLAMFVFGSLLAARRERWTLSSLLAAAATIVRPFGFFCLAAIGLTLIRRRDWKRFAGAVVVASALGGLYFLFLGLRFGQPLANVAFYKKFGLGVDTTFIPFVTIWSSAKAALVTKRNVVKALVWMTLTLFAAVCAIRRRRELAERLGAATEWTFAVLYCSSFVFFPAWWIESEYQRYVIPVVPLLLVAAERWLPRDRRVIWAIALFVSTFVAVRTMPWFEALVP